MKVNEEMPFLGSGMMGTSEVGTSSTSSCCLDILNKSKQSYAPLFKLADKSSKSFYVSVLLQRLKDSATALASLRW